MVDAPSVSGSALTPGQSFTLRATVRNRGDGRAAAATLRYYRSSNSNISPADTQVGTDSVPGLPASGSASESVRLSAPAGAGTYYYGACADRVGGERDTGNNCSRGVRVVVEDPGGDTGGDTGDGTGGDTAGGGPASIPPEMVTIPGGSFRMGDLSGHGSSVHSVTVPAFRMGKYEVTFAQWDACVADGGCDGYSPDDAGWGRGNRPVMDVSWNNAQSFIDWLNRRTGGNYRLPTEAEWEYAARAGTTTLYSWGNDIGVNRANCANYACGDSYQYTAPVGSFPANPWGLHDVHGNVYEWVQDCGHHYEGAPSDGSAWISSCDDGFGGDESYNDENSQRVIRGGSWSHFPWNLRSAYRGWLTRSNRYAVLGFRLAQDL